MTKRYLEERTKCNESADTVMADAMRHFHSRQDLGRAVMVCESPETSLALAKKQWFKLSRELQRRRGVTTNPIEILKYTYTIAAMQHVVFSSDLPEHQPEAKLYVLRPDQATQTMLGASTLYVACPLEPALGQALVQRMPAAGLVVDYTGTMAAHRWPDALRPRIELEEAAAHAWDKLDKYLLSKRVEIRQLMERGGGDAMDDAVDQLLGVDAEFLQQASAFQRTLDLARPLVSTPKQTRDRYEAAIMLAHRVQTFASSGFSPQFLHTYSNDDFLLHDQPAGIADATVADQIKRHMQAGRLNLVRALLGGELAVGTR